MSILPRDTQIQPLYPLRIDPSAGPYASVSGPDESLRQDFIFLLQTIPGEWPMNPDLGVGLSTYLFEDSKSLELSDIEENIRNQLRKYLPNITLIKATFDTSSENLDDHISTLKIVYSIPDLGLSDELNFDLLSPLDLQQSMVKLNTDSLYGNLNKKRN
jgi:phage baseplate assembly protein W